MEVEMLDERQDSIRQGIGAPRESGIGRRAEEERRTQAGDAPPIGGAMGGTSDAESPGDEAAMRAAMRESESREYEDDGRRHDYWNLPSRLRGRLLPPE